MNLLMYCIVFMLLLIGFDRTTLDCHFMAIDPERVGLKNIEVPQICDFGDNILDYLTKGGRANGTSTDDVEGEVIESESDDDMIETTNSDAHGEDSFSDEESTSSSDSSVISEGEDDYTGVLPPKFIAFLKS
jgi:hypothetical protein